MLSSSCISTRSGSPKYEKAALRWLGRDTVVDSLWRFAQPSPDAVR
jgi:hypothetical protein